MLWMIIKPTVGANPQESQVVMIRPRHIPPNACFDDPADHIDLPEIIAQGMLSLPFSYANVAIS